MKTRQSPRRSETHGSDSSHRQELALLTRVNHDMRSPLSVIMGVLELLDDPGSSLSEGERRYLKLCMKAADDLLTLADGLRLYSAVGRNLLNLEPAPVNLGAMAVEQLETALTAKGIGVSSKGLGGTPALGDAGYLKVALSSLARHLATHLPDEQPSVFLITEHVDDTGRVVVEISAGEDVAAADPVHTCGYQPEEIGVLNALRLIELMGGRAYLAPEAPRVVIELPASAVPA